MACLFCGNPYTTTHGTIKHGDGWRRARQFGHGAVTVQKLADSVEAGCLDCCLIANILAVAADQTSPSPLTLLKVREDGVIIADQEVAGDNMSHLRDGDRFRDRLDGIALHPYATQGDDGSCHLPAHRGAC